MNQPQQSTRSGHGPSLTRVLTITALCLVMLTAGILLAGPVKRGIALLRDAVTSDGTATQGQPGGVTLYQSGMHPWIITTEPGNCPICGMKLEPIDPRKLTGELAIDPRITQSMGVRVEPVVTGPLVKTIRTVGTVDYDETRVRDVNTKVAGWIEKVHVDFEGTAVTRGDPLFDLYSPQLYVAQDQYLLALRNQAKLGENALPEIAADTRRMVESSRTQLELFDVPGPLLERIAETGLPQKTITFPSPHTGVVTVKHANEGMRLDPNMLVYRIADLSKVWVQVALYESDLPFVELGQKAVMTLPYIPGQPFEGQVIYRYPYLDEGTRQVRIRLEFDNEAGLLMPGMYANVELRGTLAAQTTLAPRSAVIDTGQRQVAFVSKGEGRFEPRDVMLGPQTGDGMVQVLDGLRPGEMVVTSGQFLLDSESKVREALAKMVKGKLAVEQQAEVAVAGDAELQALPEAARAELAQAVEAYMAIGESLAQDQTDGVPAQARNVASAVDRLLLVDLPDAPHFWHQHNEAATIRGKALELIEAKDIEAARLIYADLSIALSKLLRATGVPDSLGKQVHQLHCPMYREGQGGGIWLQAEGEVRNPFFGARMLRCFDKRSALPMAGGGEQP
jgi:RND family efflux transporter MFP subunit